MQKWIDSMNTNDTESLDLLVAKFFYRTGILFNTVDCDEWKAMWNFVRSSYSPPSSKKLHTILLQRTNKMVKEECLNVIKDAETVALVTDGWSNMRKDHLVNYITVILN